MAILDSKADRGIILRILLSTGLGAIFGFQGWRLAQYGYPVSMPWYAALWVFTRHLALGLSLGITASSTPWWKRGVGLGALFSFPSALALCLMNLRWAPRGLALCTASISAGVLIAFLTDLICPRRRQPAHDSPAPEQRTDAKKQNRRDRDGDIHLRLAEGKSRLECLDAERELRREPEFGQTAEDKIVWRELLELELQDIDDQVSRGEHQARNHHNCNGR
ncbi:MAG TPA: hypothetical protein VLW65_16325 [Bryobacteraceae bacterium]|nr:hypothetical protein [Bryobacteraceae bacterium]